MNNPVQGPSQSTISMPAQTSKPSTSGSSSKTNKSVTKSDMSETAPKPGKSNMPTLETYFKCVLDRKAIEVNYDDLNNVIKHDILIPDLTGLDERLRNMLPLLLVYYIRLWPGWQKNEEYVSKTLTYSEWFSRFRQYIHFKLNNTIMNTFNKVVKEMKTNESNKAPFQIRIEGGPSLMNSLLFINEKDDIVMRRHVGSEFKGLTAEFLTNWPFIEIDFVSPELSFSRKFLPEYKRYLSKMDEKARFEPCERIEEIRTILPDTKRVVVSTDILKAYFNRYLQVLNTVNPFTINEKEIKYLFDEVLKDVEEINMKSTIASNTAIVFNIGEGCYIRSKKIRNPSKGKEMLVKYAELLIPKVELEFRVFNATPVRSPVAPDGIDFIKLSEIASKGATAAEAKTFFPEILYKCIFCHRKFVLPKSLISHLQEEHFFEQCVFCIKCHKQFEVSMLSLSRWRHECECIVLV